MRILALPFLLAVAACATKPPVNLAAPAEIGTVDWNKATVVDVQLDDFHFRPASLRFAKGAPVRLVLTNVGAVEHNFVAPGFFAEAILKPGQTPPGADGVTLKAGARTEIVLAPTRADTYALECTELLHPMLGMTGTIVVTP
jgi:uncharacterized cupredoxin-like copper-binding protein